MGDQNKKNSHEVTDVIGPPSLGRRRWLAALWDAGSVMHELPELGIVEIGRGENATIRIDDGSISRRHAKILLAADEMRVEDLGSSNGTVLDGKRLQPGAPETLRPGATLVLGKVTVVVRDPRYRSPASEPARAASDDVVVCDPAMERIHELVELAAKSMLSVLLLGETGVGKEVIASRLHALSPRAEKPLVRVNCAALVESLLEAELFGYEKGAFTGANAAKPGLLETATGGTLFLDEIGEMPLATQAKLLRVLESGEVTRVGGVKPRPVDVRFIAATNRNPREEIARGALRQDLFFRLDGMSIRIPPLRDRPSEIAALAETFARQTCARSGRRPVAISQEALTRLVAYPWPGNARELRNVIARAVLLCQGDTVQPEHLHFEAMGMDDKTSPPGARVPVALRSSPTSTSDVHFDEQRVRDALEECAGNQTRAAKLLGVSRSTLVRWLDQMGAVRPRK